MIGISGIRAQGTLSWPDVWAFDRKFVRAMAIANLNLAAAAVPPARREAPKLSGRLADSIRPHRGRWYRATIKAGNRRLPYAGAVHFGWEKHNIKPNPFLERGAEQIKDRAKRAYVQAVERAARRAMARNLVRRVF